MENIIKSILEIDQMAKDKIKNAEDERNKIIAEAKSDKDRLIELKLNEADKKLNELMECEKSKAEDSLCKIKIELNSETKRLDEVFQKNNEEWQNKIFNDIING